MFVILNENRFNYARKKKKPFANSHLEISLQIIFNRDIVLKNCIIYV